MTLSIEFRRHIKENFTYYYMGKQMMTNRPFASYGTFSWMEICEACLGGEVGESPSPWQCLA